MPGKQAANFQALSEDLQLKQHLTWYMIAYFKHYSGDHVKNNEMVWACSMHGGEYGSIQGFGGGNLRKRDHLENPGVDGRIILTLWRRIFFFNFSALCI